MDSNVLVEKVLPVYFKEAKYTSFVSGFDLYLLLLIGMFSFVDCVWKYYTR